MKLGRAYLVFTIDGSTGRVHHVGIYSEPTPTLISPGPTLQVQSAHRHLQSATGDDYDEARGKMRALVLRALDAFGRPGAPVRDALERMANGGDGRVRWPD